MAKGLDQITPKIIYRVDYKPILDFYNKLFATTDLTRHFPDWETDRLSVTLKDFTKHHSLKTTVNYTVFESDKFVPNELKKVISLIENVQNLFNKSDVTRIGYRSYTFIPTPDLRFEELVEIINLKLFNSEFVKLVNTPVDNSAILVLKFENEINCRITIGPMREFEVTNHLSINVKDNFNEKSNEKLNKIYKALTSYPKLSLYLDADFFTTQNQELLRFFEQSSSNFATLCNNLKQFILKDRL